MKSNKNNLLHIILTQTSDSEKHKISLWAQKLLQIRDSKKPILSKTKQAILISYEDKIVIMFLKKFSKDIKKFLWTNRGYKSRLAFAGIASGALFFPGQSAGIAAMGGAIGLPLWIIFGAGGTFAGLIIEEIEKALKNDTNIIDIEENAEAEDFITEYAKVKEIEPPM